MRAKMLFPILLTIALAVAGCSATANLPGELQRAGRFLAPSSSASGEAPAATPTANAPGTLRSVNDADYAAIQDVIQKANAEQQDAFAKHDPSVMQDTATSDYYNQMAQINSDMADNGISAIKLVKLEWGPITLTDATTAQATTYETWETTAQDGSTDQSRDRNVYTLVKEQGSWKIQDDQQPDSGVQTPPGQAPGPTSPAPSGPTSPAPSGPTPPSARVRPGSSGVSNNWSGYAAGNGTYTGVTGTWTVPQSNGSGGFSSGATWVGIGGVDGRDLIQAGTEETSGRAGQIRYQAWIEMLPQSSRTVRLAVTPGDSVTASITEQGTNQWLIALKNNTTGESYQTTVQYASSQSSAEWVEEAPSAGRRVLPLDNFGSVQFTGGSALKDGKWLTIAQSGAQPITMTDVRGVALATPSGLTSDGSGFSVNRSDAAATASPFGAGGFGSRPRSRR